MAIVFSRTGVENYDRWRREFDSHGEIRRDAGIDVVGIFRNVDETNDVLIVIDVPDAAAFGAQLQTPQLVEAIQKSGISTDVEYWAGDHMATVPMKR